MSRILPRYTDTRLEDERAIARAIIDSGQRIELDQHANPGDLRGIPIVGHGIGGTSPGTNPYTAIDRLDLRNV